MVVQTIDTYIAQFPSEVQAILEKIRQTIHEAAPDAIEAISYGLATFKLNGKNLVHFGGWQHHIGFYPTPSGTEAFKKELSAYQHARGSVQFPLDQPVPYDLIREIVKFRLKEFQSSRK
jgi:uncharacterized protein YdhG (YjbR/CyaY superfamily)